MRLQNVTTLRISISMGFQYRRMFRPETFGHSKLEVGCNLCECVSLYTLELRQCNWLATFDPPTKSWRPILVNRRAICERWTASSVLHVHLRRQRKQADRSDTSFIVTTRTDELMSHPYFHHPPQRPPAAYPPREPSPASAPQPKSSPS